MPGVALKRAILTSNGPERCLQVYGQGRHERLAAMTDLVPGVLTSEQLLARLDEFADVEVLFSTWGMPRLEAVTLDRLPKLAAVFYAAGSVRSFAVPLLERDIVVVSGWGANAIPVAEFTVAQILLACNGYFRNTRDYTGPEAPHQLHRGVGVFGESIGLIGVGMVARAVIERLKPYQLRIVVHDPYLADDDARCLGVDKVSLDELFAQVYVVSNHLPNVPDLEGVLDGRLFARMRQDATFINTGRGAQVVEADLLRVWQARPDLTALLDVTFPEPPEAGSLFYTLPNVQLSSHIAGSMNDELVRMADFVLDDFERWQRGEALMYQVTADVLERMA